MKERSLEKITSEICKICVYKDRIDEFDAFKTRDHDKLIEHYQEEHGIDFNKNQEKIAKINKNPMKYGLIDWNETEKPMSKQLMFIKGNFAPIQLRVIESDKNDFIDLYMPSFPIVFGLEHNINIPVTINKKRYKVNFSIKEDTNAMELPYYMIPISYHNDCYECPMVFDKEVVNSKDYLSFEETERISKWEKELLKFKCNLNLCIGFINEYKDRIYILIEIEGKNYVKKFKEEQKSI